MKSLFECTMHETERKEYFNDISYGQKDWTMVSALRELLSNMIDTKANYNFFYNEDKGFGVIEDSGTGLPMKAFVFGGSTKSNDIASIGQYGEGLKMALLTALRNEKRISIQTVGYGVEIESTYSELYDSNLMVLVFNDNARECGTSIRVECSLEDWDAAIDLFLQFKEDYQKLDNNLYLPGGYISILGVKTEERPNLRFSYDLNDKTLTNRDRNVIKAKAFKLSMEKILNGLKNQKAIKTYLDGMETSIDNEEYKLELSPKNTDVWVSTIQKVYGDKYAYSTTVEYDIKAKAKGYTIIPTFTKGTQKTFENLGITSSKDVSKGMRTNDVVVVENNKMIYPISRNYVKSWSWLDAGREFLSNAIDSCINSNAIIEYDNGYCVIKDNGYGISKNNFVIGDSNKSEQEIGMFGEGLKLAMLVMAREDRDLTISTVGNDYKPMLENNSTYCSEIFAITFEENDMDNGTIVRFKATKEEVLAIKNLFIGYKDDVEMKSFGIVDVITNESGNIYVNGLKTKSMNCIYSYNIKDKRLVNTRDRNSVDETLLDEILSNFYNTIEDEEIVVDFLTKWKEDNRLYEYKLIIVPDNINYWTNLVTKTFENTCISDNYDMESNFIAKNANYELLVDIPSYVKDILSVSLPSSYSIAQEYKEKGILLGNRIIYPISSEYVTNWNAADAIVELISNALDTNTEVSTVAKNGAIVIEDKGNGFEKKNLLFGESNSRQVGTAIGTFGEGLKMACLVLARTTNDRVIIETVGFTAIASVLYDSEYQTKVLVLDLEENERTIGTKISFNGTKELLDVAKSRFLIYNDKYEKVTDDFEIYTPSGALFVNGVYTTSTNSIYSYNFVGKAGKRLLNRDRKSIDSNDLRLAICDLMSSISDEDVVESILRLKDGTKIENYVGLNTFLLNGRFKRKWRKVADKVFPKSCLPLENTDINLVAKDCGFHVLVDILDSTKRFLQYIGFPNANEVISLRGDEDVARRVIDVTDLTKDEKLIWDRVMHIVGEQYGKSVVDKVVICEEFSTTNPDVGKTYGLYSPKHNMCYILRELVTENNFERLLGVVVHEIIHMETGYLDRTRDFENALTYAIGEFLCKLYG